MPKFTLLPSSFEVFLYFGPAGSLRGGSSHLHTIPRNLRGRFRGFARVGGVRDPPFQHLKIDFSTLNPGVQVIVRFVPYTVRQLVNYCPGNNWYARIGWFGRSGTEPGCLGGLVRRRSFALLGTRVRAPAPPSRNFPGKSSKSEKIHHWSREEPSDPSSVPFIVRLAPFIVQLVPFIVRSASGSMCSFPSEVRP